MPLATEFTTSAEFHGEVSGEKPWGFKILIDSQTNSKWLHFRDCKHQKYAGGGMPPTLPPQCA